MGTKRERKCLPAAHGRLNVRVFKVGGPAVEDPRLIGPLADEVRRSEGHSVLVHGGGRHVERMLRVLGIESSFVNGRRETSPAAMEVVEMVLSGVVNKGLASELTAAGVKAVGLSGRDGGLLTAQTVPELGRVGTRVAAHPEAILALWNAGLLPVVSPVSNGPTGEALNVNADEAALGLARALFARSLVYLSDVDGVQVDGETAEELDAACAEQLIEDGVIAGGMALKVRVALEASRAGVPEVVIAGRARLEGGFPGTRLFARLAQELRA